MTEVVDRGDPRLASIAGIRVIDVDTHLTEPAAQYGRARADAGTDVIGVLRCHELSTSKHTPAGR